MAETPHVMVGQVYDLRAERQLEHADFWRVVDVTGADVFCRHVVRRTHYRYWPLRAFTRERLATKAEVAAAERAR